MVRENHFGKIQPGVVTATKAGAHLLVIAWYSAASHVLFACWLRNTYDVNGYGTTRGDDVWLTSL